MAKNLTDRLKGAIYGAAAKIGEAVKGIGKQIDNREGVVGKVGGAITDAYKATSDSISNVHHKVQEQGGYIESVKKAGKKVGNTAVGGYESVRDTFFTQNQEGNFSFDVQKAKQAIRDSGSAVAGLGKKAYTSLSDLVQKSAEAIGNDYRKFVPTQEEIDSKYPGIGKEYEGLLLREHYESCLEFYKTAMEKLPKGTKYKREILEDIKLSASSSAEDLLSYYYFKQKQKFDFSDERIKGKKAICSKYLSQNL